MDLSTVFRVAATVACLVAMQAHAARTETRADAPGSDVYVSPVGIDDPARDGSLGTPWRTISFAMNAAGPFATLERPITIHLAPWRYEERVVFRPHMRLEGADISGPASTKIAPPASVFSPEEFAAIVAAENTALAGFTLDLPADAPDSVVALLVDDVRVEIRSLLLNGFGAPGAVGVRITGPGTSGSVLAGCVLERFQDGLHSVGSSINVAGNVFQEIARDAVLVGAPAAPVSNGSSVPLLGDLHRLTETGANCFRGIGGRFVANLSAETVLAQSCNWEGRDTAEEILAKMYGDVNFEPFLLGPTVLAAAIAVMVEDDTTQTPISSATVSLIPALFAPITENYDGVYFFTPLVQDAYTVQIEAPGYEMERIFGVDAPAGGVAAVQARLRAEGSEGEGESVSTREAAEALLNGFDATDADHDGQLSYVEAVSGADGLTAAQFAELDRNADNALTAAELRLALSAPTWSCHVLEQLGFKHALGDLSVLALYMSVLAGAGFVNRRT
ncbi:MAG: DUF1565 domain-containing protein [Candidatus Hydrogenedentes bacterium]|nr:DUF1565 domain-containing protein [Candidatus Hydrogenedentota bacterium]